MRRRRRRASTRCSGLPLSTDDELFEVRQSDAFYDQLPDAAEHATLAWMPTAPPDEAPEGAESFAEILGRVRRSRERLEAAGPQRLLVVSHYGVLHFMLGLTLFGDDFGPEHLLPVYRSATPTPASRSSRATSTVCLDGIPFPGWALTTWNDRAHL